MLWIRYVQRKLRFFCVFWPCPLKTTPRRTFGADVLWHQNKATQYVIKLYYAIFCESVGQWILFGVSQWILFGVSSWHLVWEATWFLHDSQLCGNPKLNHAATHNACMSIEQWLLTWSNRPGYHWKAESVNFSIPITIKPLLNRELLY